MNNSGYKEIIFNTSPLAHRITTYPPTQPSTVFSQLKHGRSDAPPLLTREEIIISCFAKEYLNRNSSLCR